MNDADAYDLLVKGRELLAGGHNHQAALILEKAAQIEPTKASIREPLARAFFNSGQIRKASEEFERTLEIDPSDHYAHFGLALCRARLGDKAKAVGLLKIAIAMNPDSEDYRRALNRLAG